MANTDAPSGFRLVGTISGAAFNASVRMYSIPASDGTATFLGDAVKTNGTADADGTPQVIQAAAGNTVRGVIVGFVPDYTNLETKHRLASTQRFCYVCDDPRALFEVQEDSDAGDMAITAVSGNVDIVVGAGSTTSGRSGMELDSSSVTGSSTAQCRLISIVTRADNEIGTNAKWLVTFNEHELASTTGV